MNENSDGWKLVSVVPADEAIKKSKKDVKELSKYLYEIKNCKK